ncbi:MAG TPA: VOC family protein, partial [Dehalococcoidia bacterium]|nr:VOC family protein [Dehalococcoidia bacterium]
RPTLGGRFAQMGAYNHILSLGGGAYVEVIGPDPDVPAPTQPRPFGLDGLTEPRLTTWAAKETDLAAKVEAARAAGYDMGQALPLSRELPDGTTLAWTLTVRSAPPGPEGGLVPFLIDWGDATHPSETGAQGCQLVEFHGEHPDPEMVLKSLEVVGQPINVKKAERPGMVATIQGPKGQIELR